MLIPKIRLEIFSVSNLAKHSSTKSSNIANGSRMTYFSPNIDTCIAMTFQDFVMFFTDKIAANYIALT